MTHINSYLIFNGNCREAMTYYQTCLGGELYLQTIGESPMADKMPMQMKDSILHATLTHGGVIIMGSDMASEHGIVKGNSISLMLNCESEEEIKDCYKKLAEGGTASHPLENTFGVHCSGA